MENKKDINRLLQDIEEGIIIIDNDGTISSINPKALKILNIKGDYIGRKYASFFSTDNNDEFHQMIIDAVENKRISHKKRIKYNTSNTINTLYISSSILKDSEDNQIGVILSFDDVTIEEVLKKKISDSALIFIILVALLSIWMFACAVFINDENPINSSLFGRFIMYLPLLFTPVAIKICGFTIEDLGLKIDGIKKHIKLDTLLTLIGVLVMCLIKLIILKVNPSFTFYNPNNVFFDFSKYTILGRLEYGICVISQEYLSRGLVYECVRRIVSTDKNSKYVDTIAIIVSSLYFAALHIYLGVTYMIGAFVLLSIFGLLYKKQRSIWGLCIPHYILGMMIEILGFTMV